MFVPLTVNDFLRRAELLYPGRVGVVDEPDQPAASWGSLTNRRVAEHARAQPAALDGRVVGHVDVCRSRRARPRHRRRAR